MKRFLIPAMLLTMCLVSTSYLAADEDPAEIKARSKISGRIVIIGPDGKKQERKFGSDNANAKGVPTDLPKEIRERLEKALRDGTAKFGKWIIIGPDGKKHEFEFGDGKDGEKDVFKGLPKELRQQIEKAMKGGAFGGSFRIDSARIETYKPGAKTEKDQANDKLDLILKRLESIERELQELKKKMK